MILVWILLLLSSSSCGDQTYADIYSETDVIIENAQLPADSVSTTVITTKLKRPLNKNQEVSISTSHGGILVPPYDFSDIPRKQVLLRPFSDEFEVLLIANTLDTTDRVFVSIGLDSFFKKREVKFTASLPEDIKLSSNVRIINTDETEIELVADLYRSSGYVSNGIRFYPRAVVESLHTLLQDTLLWSLPPYVTSMDNLVKVPLTILNHVAGTRLRVYLSTDRTANGFLERDILLFTE